MKKYETPQIEEIKVQVEDVIAASYGDDGGDVHKIWGEPVHPVIK